MDDTVAVEDEADEASTPSKRAKRTKASPKRAAKSPKGKGAAKKPKAEDDDDDEPTDPLEEPERTSCSGKATTEERVVSRVGRIARRSCRVSVVSRVVSRVSDSHFAVSPTQSKSWSRLSLSKCARRCASPSPRPTRTICPSTRCFRW